MPVIVSSYPLRLARRIQGVRVVKPNNPFTVGTMQSQAVFDSVRPTSADSDAMRLNFYPVTTLLTLSKAIEFQQSLKPEVFMILAAMARAHAKT